MSLVVTEHWVAFVPKPIIISGHAAKHDETREIDSNVSYAVMHLAGLARSPYLVGAAWLPGRAVWCSPHEGHILA